MCSNPRTASLLFCFFSVLWLPSAPVSSGSGWTGCPPSPCLERGIPSPSNPRRWTWPRWCSRWAEWWSARWWTSTRASEFFLDRVLRLSSFCRCCRPLSGPVCPWPFVPQTLPSLLADSSKGGRMPQHPVWRSLWWPVSGLNFSRAEAANWFLSTSPAGCNTFLWSVHLLLSVSPGKWATAPQWGGRWWRKSTLYQSPIPMLCESSFSVRLIASWPCLAACRPSSGWHSPRRRVRTPPRGSGGPASGRASPGCPWVPCLGSLSPGPHGCLPPWWGIWSASSWAWPSHVRSSPTCRRHCQASSALRLQHLASGLSCWYSQQILIGWESLVGVVIWFVRPYVFNVFFGWLFSAHYNFALQVKGITIAL